MLILALVFSIFSALIKLIGGFLSNSYSLIADGADSTINILTMSIATYLYLLSQRPPDKEHPYGHYGFEVLSAVITSLIMAFIAAIIATLAILRIGEAHIVYGIGIYFSAISTVFLVISIVLFYRVSKEHSSLALRAEIRHLMVDVVESLIVFLGVTFAVIANPVYDLIAALVVIGFMGKGIIENLLEVSESVTYKAPSEAPIRNIVKIAEDIPKVKRCYKVRVRKLGDALFLDLSIITESGISIEEAHEIAHKVENEIKRKLRNVKDVVVHIEPFYSKTL